MKENNRMANNVHSGHRQRLKERGLTEGLDSFDAHQLLELLLFYAIPYKDTNELAHRLIDHFGSFSAVLDADYKQLMEVKGVGLNTASLLTLIPGICRRYQLDRWGEKIHIDSSYTLGEYAVNLFIGCNYEKFFLICLDAQSNVIQSVLINEGTLNEVSVYPRVVVEIALRHKAHSVVLTHNHPGGTLRPSAGDIQLTRRLVSVLNEINISVNDHIIVCGNRYISFAAKGLLFG